MKKTYSELLRDPRWQRKRLEILNRSNFACDECNASDKTLNVHHKRYKKGAAPWEYDNNDLCSLCEDCHERRHDLEKAIRSRLERLSNDDLEGVLGYVEGNCLNTDEGNSISLRGPRYINGLADALGDSWLSYRRLHDMVEAGRFTLTAAEAESIAEEAFAQGGE